ncbi:hypothetical protein AwWohl_06050 [Gammaproteobacteria bacterium]|nr:hypothetical protein AwWohl_06050 [Gammaproteobacteria bacterium]
MSKNQLILDEEKYPIAWRFNSEDCLLSFDDKIKITFLDKNESECLWNSLFPFDHLMRMDSSFLSIIEKVKLDFCDLEISSVFFNEKLKNTSLVFFFWGKKSSAIVPVDIFLKSWSDFFYPSDETSILLLANKSKIIFSYEETFFYCGVVTQM